MIVKQDLCHRTAVAKEQSDVYTEQMQWAEGLLTQDFTGTILYQAGQLIYKGLSSELLSLKCDFPASGLRLQQAQAVKSASCMLSRQCCLAASAVFESCLHKTMSDQPLLVPSGLHSVKQLTRKAPVTRKTPQEGPTEQPFVLKSSCCCRDQQCQMR